MRNPFGGFPHAFPFVLCTAVRRRGRARYWRAGLPCVIFVIPLQHWCRTPAARDIGGKWVLFGVFWLLLHCFLWNSSRDCVTLTCLLLTGLIKFPVLSMYFATAVVYLSLQVAIRRRKFSFG